MILKLFTVFSEVLRLKLTTVKGQPLKKIKDEINNCYTLDRGKKMEVQNPINTTHILKAIIQCPKKKKAKKHNRS